MPPYNLDFNNSFKKFRRSTAIIILVVFAISSVKTPAFAQLDPMPFMPKPGVMVHISPEFTPAYLSGIVIHPENALKFDFIVYKGDKALSDEDKKIEYTKLCKYFLASLAIPDDDQWVNLSPYEKDRIIKDDFGKTEMGRDLLAQDYMLKQITASLIYPQDNLGKEFWDKVYAQAQEQYGTSNIPVNTFNKVWIVPDDAEIYEKGNTAFVFKSHLKVMMDEDYLSLKKHTGIQSIPKDNKNHTVASKIVKEIILPELEREVNDGKNFAALRQVFSGMILAAWYKRALKESLLSKIYANRSKVKGVDQDPKTNEQIYQQYLKAYKKGVFNLIKDDVDKYTNQTIPRKYFSGGVGVNAKVLDEAIHLFPANSAMGSARTSDKIGDGSKYLEITVLAEENLAMASAQQAIARKSTLSPAMTAEQIKVIKEATYEALIDLSKNIDNVQRRQAVIGFLNRQDPHVTADAIFDYMNFMLDVLISRQQGYFEAEIERKRLEDSGLENEPSNSIRVGSINYYFHPGNIPERLNRDIISALAAGWHPTVQDAYGEFIEHIGRFESLVMGLIPDLQPAIGEAFVSIVEQNLLNRNIYGDHGNAYYAHQLEEGTGAMVQGQDLQGWIRLMNAVRTNLLIAYGRFSFWNFVNSLTFVKIQENTAFEQYRNMTFARMIDEFLGENNEQEQQKMIQIMSLRYRSKLSEIGVDQIKAEQLIQRLEQLLNTNSTSPFIRRAAIRLLEELEAIPTSEIDKYLMREYHTIAQSVNDLQQRWWLVYNIMPRRESISNGGLTTDSQQVQMMDSLRNSFFNHESPDSILTNVEERFRGQDFVLELARLILSGETAPQEVSAAMTSRELPFEDKMGVMIFHGNTAAALALKVARLYDGAIKIEGRTRDPLVVLEELRKQEKRKPLPTIKRAEIVPLEDNQNGFRVTSYLGDDLSGRTLYAPQRDLIPVVLRNFQTNTEHTFMIKRNNVGAVEDIGLLGEVPGEVQSFRSLMEANPANEEHKIALSNENREAFQNTAFILEQTQRDLIKSASEGVVKTEVNRFYGPLIEAFYKLHDNSKSAAMVVDMESDRRLVLEILSIVRGVEPLSAHELDALIFKVERSVTIEEIISAIESVPNEKTYKNQLARTARLLRDLYRLTHNNPASEGDHRPLSKVTRETVLNMKPILIGLFPLYADQINRALGQVSGSTTSRQVLDVVQTLPQAVINSLKDNGVYLTLVKAANLDESQAMMTLEEQKSFADKGGIDLNASNLHLQIKRDGKGVALPISQQNLENIHIDGLIPVILDIKPALEAPLLTQLQKGNNLKPDVSVVG